MKKTFLLMACVMWSLVTVTLQAQEAIKILDKSAATLKTAGNVKIGFTYEAAGGATTGYLKLHGQKFVLSTGNSITWFDGKTMWTYVKANEEVNVTTPSADAVAKMNPYSFLSFYKKGYTATMGKSTAREHEVVLTGKGGSPYKRVVVRVHKSTHYPSSISMTSAKDVTTTIRCNSFLKNQKFQESTFRFNQKEFPGAEVVDLR